MWTHLVEAFPEVSRKIRLALPCVGLDSLCAGLLEMKFSAFDVIYAYDIDSSLVPHLLSLHGIGLGLGGDAGFGQAGGFLSVDVTAWERVDFLMSGPPCPPWSSIGQRRGQDDIRERVFVHITLCIEHQAQLGSYGFLVELVPAIDHRLTSASGEQTYYQNWLVRLRHGVPVWPWPIYCIEACVPSMSSLCHHSKGQI